MSVIHPMRGQCVIREDLSVHKYRGSILVPEVSNIDNRNAVARTRKWHIGEVLALGTPMLSKGGVPVPYGFGVGDRVLFHWVHNEKGHTLEWSDGLPACWIPQWAVDAVVEPIDYEATFTVAREDVGLEPGESISSRCGATYEYPHRGHVRESKCERHYGHVGIHIGEEKT